MSSPYAPPGAPLDEPRRVGLAAPARWRLRAIAWTQIVGGAFAVALFIAGMSLLAQPLLLLFAVPSVVAAAIGVSLLRDPPSWVDPMRWILWAQVVNLTIAGWGYDFHLGAIARIGIVGSLIDLRAGPASSFQLFLGEAEPFRLGVNLVPLVLLAWLQRVERELRRGFAPAETPGPA